MLTLLPRLQVVLEKRDLRSRLSLFSPPWQRHRDDEETRTRLTLGTTRATASLRKFATTTRPPASSRARFVRARAVVVVVVSPAILSVRRVAIVQRRLRGEMPT